MMFNNVLNGKKRFLDYKNVLLTQWDTVHFFLRGYPMIFVKNLKFILSLIFFEKDLDMVFNNVLNKKRVF